MITLGKQIIQFPGNIEFRQGTTYDFKEQGYQKMKKGCEILLNYMKQEQNQVLKQFAKEHLVKIISQLEEMKVYLETYKKNLEQEKVKAIPENINQSEKWSKIVGIDKTKASLAEAILIPLQFPDLFTGLRKPWRGILLFGPAGSGKESLARACAVKSNATLFFLTTESFSEENIKSCFQVAKNQNKSLIFIKEIDQLQNQYNKAKIELIIQMEQNTDCGHIQVLGGTSIPWAVDTEILKRFEKKIYIQLPNYDRRRQLIKNQLKNMKQIITDEQLEQINKMLDGYTIAEINKIILHACQESKSQLQTTFLQQQKYETPTPSMDIGVKFSDFINVIANYKPSDITKYQEWNDKFGSEK